MSARPNIYRLQKNYYQLLFRIDDIRQTYVHNETCQNTVPQAIERFLESTSYEDTIRIAISLGGDSDTIAAIAGAIAEAYYGIAGDLEWKTRRFLDERLAGILDERNEFACDYMEASYERIKEYLDEIIAEMRLAKTKDELIELSARMEKLCADNNVPNHLKRIFPEACWNLLLQHYE